MSLIRKALTTSIIYGTGLGFGVALSELLLNRVSIQSLTGEPPPLVAAILLAFLIMAAGGAVSGFLGGLTLTRVNPNQSRIRYAASSALSLGAAFSLIIFPSLLIISLIAFYDSDGVPARNFMILYAVVGLLFGGLTGLILGLLTVKKEQRVLRVAGNSMLGFCLGGIALGYGIWSFIYSTKAGDTATGDIFWLVIGIFLFGAIGGGSLGLVFSRIQQQGYTPPEFMTIQQRRIRQVIWALVGLAIVVGIILPFRDALLDVLTRRTGGLSRVLVSQSQGTAWADLTEVTATLKNGGTATSPGIFVANNNRIYLTWLVEQTQGSKLVYVSGVWDRDKLSTEWSDLVSVTETHRGSVDAPQIVVDSSGKIHIIWNDVNDQGDRNIFYTQCDGGVCKPAQTISAEADIKCPAITSPIVAAEGQPGLAIDQNGALMAVWSTTSGALAYRSWLDYQAAPQSEGGCVQQSVNQEPGSRASEPRLVSSMAGSFSLAFMNGFSQDSEIRLVQFSDSAWSETSNRLGAGQSPEIIAEEANTSTVAWCGPDGSIQVGNAKKVISIPASFCTGRPGLGMDENGNLHVVWQANRVVKNTGSLDSTDLLYESIRKGQAWSEPVIAAWLEHPAYPVLMNGQDGTLHMALIGDQPGRLGVYYTTQTQYTCDGQPSTLFSQIVYQIAAQEKYRQPGSQIPYCRNRFDRFIYTPNTRKEFSQTPPTTNGGFDMIADLVRSANYEVLFSTMWYDSDVNDDSPGSVLAAAVADLYQELKDHPERYPRGLTVRILLGNPPELARGEFSNQIWNALEDLSDEGISEMTNPDLGWKLEVANFRGQIPHSHSKILVIDGITAVAAGFNMSYAHFDVDHPSGLGTGRWDLGMQITGPVAQDTMVAFDDLWRGALQIQCADLHPAGDVDWRSTCRQKVGIVDHVPEVLRYYSPPGGNDNVFSMFRSELHAEADEEIDAVLSAGQETIDVMQVNFTLNIICDLNLIYREVCTLDDALPWTDSILAAVEKNGARVRALIEIAPIEGIENEIAIELLQTELEKRGIADQVEIRYIQGNSHYKTVLVDDSFLIVGSQNFHYSSFASNGGLTEYSLGTDSQEAIAEFKRLFTYQWERGGHLYDSTIEISNDEGN